MLVCWVLHQQQNVHGLALAKNLNACEPICNQHKTLVCWEWHQQQNVDALAKHFLTMATGQR